MCVNGKNIKRLANKIQQVKICRFNFKGTHEMAWEGSFRLDRNGAVHFRIKTGLSI
jgi:hypothetical protein